MHRFGLVVIVAGMAVPLLTSCRDRSGGASSGTPAPPDLSQCTRIEVRIEPSALEALIGPYTGARSLLSDEELRHIESLETLVIDDPRYITPLAQVTTLASYYRPYGRESIPIEPVYYVSGWREEEEITSFVIKGPLLLTEDHIFKHNLSRWPNVSLTPQLVHFDRRLKCAENLRLLGTSTVGLSCSPSTTMIRKVAASCSMMAR